MPNDYYYISMMIREIPFWTTKKIIIIKKKSKLKKLHGKLVRIWQKTFIISFYKRPARKRSKHIITKHIIIECIYSKPFCTLFPINHDYCRDYYFIHKHIAFGFRFEKKMFELISYCVLPCVNWCLFCVCANWYFWQFIHRWFHLLITHPYHCILYTTLYYIYIQFALIRFQFQYYLLLIDNGLIIIALMLLSEWKIGKKWWTE